MLKITGTIVEIQQAFIEKAPDGREYAKQIFAIEYGDEYPRETAFEVDPDRFRGLETAQVGHTVEVSFTATSRKGKTGASAGKYFTTLRAIRMQNLSAPQNYAPQQQQAPAPNYYPPQQTAPAPAAAPVQQQPAPAFNPQENNELPF